MTHWLTLTEYARLMGVNRRTAQAWAREGRIGARRTRGGHWRVNAAYLEPREMTVTEVATALEMSPRTVRGWCEAGTLRARRRGAAGQWLVKQSEIVRFEAVRNEGGRRA